MSGTDWLRLACRTAAELSDDPRTQNGAVLVAADGRHVIGYNHVPRGVRQHQHRLTAPAKYAFLEHAERAAIYAAARAGIPTEGATLYCPWFACPDCARAIICAGVKEVVGLAGHRNATPERWLGNIIVAETMLAEAGVAMRWLAGAVGETILFDGRRFSC
jgi:dCMP deaminase